MVASPSSWPSWKTWYVATNGCNALVAAGTSAYIGIPAFVLEGAAKGNLVLLDSWPGQMRTVFGEYQETATV